MKKIWIKDLSIEKKNQIKKRLKEGNFLPFYTKSGTSVFTSRVPPDFESLWYKEDEMKNYLFHIKIGKNKMKKKVYWYEVIGIDIDTPTSKKKLTTGEMIKYAKKSLQVNKKVHKLDTSIKSKDLNDHMNAWVYLKNVGQGLRTNRKEW